ncbi:MAG: glycoside hydrolase family 2, partial [Tannerella sp.]|nr:glycoside hydrolase family 2 [Tannerella sp.]
MNNKRKLLTAYLLLLTVVTAQAQVSFGKPEKINEQWEFYLGDNPDENTKWRTLDLPHDWSIEGVLNPSLAACTGYLPGGIAWYRKQVFVPGDKQGEKVYIYFEGVSNRSEVYLNGHLLGKRPNGYVSFLYDMTPYVEYGKDNLLTVRVDHSQYADSRWYNG